MVLCVFTFIVASLVKVDENELEEVETADETAVKE